MKRKMIENEKMICDEKISLQDIFYCLFFGILLFAKGIGLYDGQNSFKVFLLLAGLCWLVKMCLTRFTWKEALAVAALTALGAISYKFSGEKAALISVMVVVGMKDVSVKRVFKVGTVIWSLCFIAMIMLSLTGMIEPLMLVHDKGALGYVIRNSLGYTHPNVLHISYVIFIAFWFYANTPAKKNMIFSVIIAFIGNLYIFLYSLSYTGFALTAAYLILIVYFTYRNERTGIENGIIQCLMPICVLTALFAPLLLKGQAFEIADKIVNWRFRLTRRYLTWENLSVLGTPLNMETGSVDCSYVYCLIYYGVILFLLFMLGYFFLIRHLVKENRGKELALVLGLVAAGFTEPFQFNFSFKNLILIFLGEYLFWLMQKKEGNCGFWNRTFQVLPIEWQMLWVKPKKLTQIRIEMKAVMKKGRSWIMAACVLGLLCGAWIGKACITVEPYVIVDKGYSDRVGGKEDYELFGELPSEIVENSLQINCTGPDTKVYVFEGKTVKMEMVRNTVSTAFAGAILGGIVCSLILYGIKRTGKRKINQREQGLIGG